MSRPTTKVLSHPTFFDIPDESWGDVEHIPKQDPNKGDIVRVSVRMADQYPRSRGNRVFGIGAATPPLPWKEDIALAIPRWIFIGQDDAVAGSRGRGRRRRGARFATGLPFIVTFGFPATCCWFEQPNGDFGQTLMRQSSCLTHGICHKLTRCMGSNNTQIAAIAEKSSKEVDLFSSGKRATGPLYRLLVTGPKEATAENAKMR